MATLFVDMFLHAFDVSVKSCGHTLDAYDGDETTKHAPRFIFQALGAGGLTSSNASIQCRSFAG
jgi:hypothetical protein